MMKYLQKLGKALMLPVAALPVCGILMGIGYALCPSTMQGGDVTGVAQIIGYLLVQAGGALIDNMAWLFAIGAAVGLSDDHDGTAGLAGLVSFLMMQRLLGPGVIETIRGITGDAAKAWEATTEGIAFAKIAGNSFIGILAAIIGAACYNKFKNTQLPDWLAFFSGKRSVAIVTAVVSIVVSVVLLFVWPVIFGGNAQIKAMKKVAGTLKLIYSQYRELQGFAQFGSDLDADTKARLAQGERIVEVLKQDRNSPVAVEKQVAILYATIHSYLKDVAVSDIAEYERRLYEYLDENVTAAGVMETIRTTGDLKPETEEQLKQVLADFTAQFLKEK